MNIATATIATFLNNSPMKIAAPNAKLPDSKKMPTAHRARYATTAIMATPKAIPASAAVFF